MRTRAVTMGIFSSSPARTMIRRYLSWCELPRGRDAGGMGSDGTETGTSGGTETGTSGGTGMGAAAEARAARGGPDGCPAE
ncbi:hypothetical protein Afil01_24160 [Actinorhabdospora filicis]|uniref:Uncharacterized protein n=1 Tax=Actinorhabdospora filicis TaxID=1785913 RepID=A0A9W6SIB1_9ACTN|nr:hypothetical protein Afil01_24160 [Actinorhabdospora filicis]